MKTKISLLQKIKFPPNHNSVNHTDNGFTMIEMIVVMLIIAILSAIAAPSWVALINRTRLNDAQDRVYQAITKAQKEARLKKITMELAIKVDSGEIQWGIVPACSQRRWDEQPVTLPGLQLDKAKTNFVATALPEVTTIMFDKQGKPVTITDCQTKQETDDPKKIITIKSDNGGQVCVKVMTLLGFIATGKTDTECKLPSGSGDW